MKYFLLHIILFLLACPVMTAQSRLELDALETSVPLQTPVLLTHIHPNGEKGWYLRGLNTENDGTYDLRQYYAIRMTLKTDQMKPVKIRCCMHRAQMEGRHNWADSTSVVVEVQGGDWQDIVIPIVAFDYNKGQSYFLKFIEKVILSVSYTHLTLPTNSLV